MPPPQVHVFSKSRQPSSLRMQAASIAYIEDSFHQKALHHCNRHHRKKAMKHKILREVILPHSIQQNLLSASVVERKLLLLMKAMLEIQQSVLWKESIGMYCQLGMESTFMLRTNMFHCRVLPIAVLAEPYHLLDRLMANHWMFLKKCL